MLKTLGLAAVAIAFASGAAVAQSAPGAPSAATAPKITDGAKLFADFGGKPGLVKIMDDFMIILLADERTAPFFAPVDQAHVKAMLVDQFCEILNGGCVYGGKDMVSAHAGMGVHEGEFYALVEDLQKAMSANGVPFSSQNKLLAALAPQHRDIVTK